MAGKSYLHTPDVEPCDFSNVSDMLDENAERIPDKEAHVFFGKSDGEESLTREAVTFRQLADTSLNVAASLLAIGVRPGDRLAIIGHPSPQWIYVEHAVLRIKTLLVRIPATLATSDKLQDFLINHKCRLLFLDPTFTPNILAVARINLDQYEIATSRHRLKDDNNGCLQMIVFLKEHPDLGTSMNFHHLIKETPNMIHEVGRIQSSIDPEDPSVVFPTTGTTGIPKLVVNSQMGQVAVLKIFANFFKVGEAGDNTCFFNNRPYTWSASFPLMAAFMGWKFVSTDQSIVNDINSLEIIMRIMDQEKSNCVFLPVFMLLTVIQQMKSLPASLLYVFTAGENIENETIKQVLKYVKVVSVFYGCTEGFGASTGNSMNELLSDEAEYMVGGAARYKPVPGSELKIVHPDGRVATIGEPGTIFVRSKTTLLFYLDDEASTATILDKRGWVNTQDVGIIHSPGFLQVIGRASDLISKGGFKIYPATIESMLAKFDKILKVAVFGIPDELYGHEIAAAVVPKSEDDLTQEMLQKFCQKHGTVTDGIPLYPQKFLIVKEFPLLANGKMDMRKLVKILDTPLVV